ncbi:hypothetical protein TorRG33x02_348760 [Trema orientale]|uniref:Uncharacterized protein n=1 Tax=Trema orientale TaxID=63057 RepID=A0A2P5AJK0_TREOI|nr:hypothetical protein TorRG33x02_348760 [Trema orientale]
MADGNGSLLVDSVGFDGGYGFVGAIGVACHRRRGRRSFAWQRSDDPLLFLCRFSGICGI